MCFSMEWSLFFSVVGLLSAAFVYKRTSNTQLLSGILFFCAMEILQVFQYLWIDQCELQVNKVLTLVGFAHICLQPLFTHVINSSLTRSKTLLSQYKIIYRLCVLSGMMLFSRYLLAEFGGPTWVKQPVISSYDNFTGIAPPENGCETAEWLRGSELCTYSGKYHLAWSVPMADATYWVPAASTHSFMMFAPFFVLKWDRANSLKEYLFRGMAIQGFFLWLAGPYLASWITPNLQEQASIWCFFSIAQITIMLFIIREQLILGWGRDKDVKNRISVMSAGKEAVKAGKAH